MKNISILILFLLALPSVVMPSGPPEHYCDDSAAWHEWENLLAKNPTDDGINSLYAFRVGLCSMVKSGKIETARAIQLFEGMRDAVLKGLYASEREQNGQGGSGI